MDMIVYTRPEVLEHKKGLIKDNDYSPVGEYAWQLPNNFPKNVNPEEDKIYFAIKGNIVGYFEIEEVRYPDIIFYCKTWKDITPIPQKPFQGFKYMK